VSPTAQSRPRAQRRNKPEPTEAPEQPQGSAEAPVRRRFAPSPRSVLWYGLIYSMVAACYFFYRDRLPDWDEPYHLEFIEAIRNLIAHGQFTSIMALYHGEKFSGLAMLPGYHIVAAIVSMWFPTYQALRLVNLSFLMILVVVVARIQKQIFQRDDFLKLVCFAFFPVTFTHALLIYTDYATLFCVTIAFYCEIKKQHFLSGLALLAGFFTRQSIVTWLVFLPLLAYCAQEQMQPESWQQTARAFFSPQGLKAQLKRYWFHVVLFGGFVVFLIVNHGIAVGDKDAQPTGAFSIGNIFIFCLFSFIFFLPGAIWNFRQHLRTLLRNDMAIAAVLLAFTAFMFLFPGPESTLHIYNTWLAHRDTQYFIRNNVVHWVVTNLALRIVAFLFAVIGFLEIHRTLSTKTAAVMTVATWMSLAPLAVMDVRYAMIPFGLYVILRNELNENLYKLQALWLFIISLSWLWGVKMEIFTPF